MKILSNRAVVEALSVSEWARRGTDLASADHYAEIDVVMPSGVTASRGLVIVRKAADAVATFYSGDWEIKSAGAEKLLRISEWTTGNRVVLAGKSFGAAGEQHRIRLSVEGTALRLYADGDLHLSTTDATIAGTLQTGFGAFHLSGSPSGVELDNWATGTMPKHPTVLGKSVV